MLQDTQSENEPGISPTCGGLSAAKAISRGCPAFPPVGSAAKVRQIENLLEAGAWTEAAIALVRLQLPDWTLRRIELDDGEWFCSLSRYPAIPYDFDERAEGRHRHLPLAVLAALAEARQQSAASEGCPPAILSTAPASGTPTWCDNCR